MDSLAQIVLGAAVGEAVLGKKIGNRAMLWGAIGGTIPDLDVLGGMFLNDLDNLAFHRGFSHSVFFGIIGAFVFGWIVNWQYKSKYHKEVVAKTRKLGWYKEEMFVRFELIE
jgi:inner membrane protein